VDEQIMDQFLDEEWSYISGFPNYAISTHGRVWSSRLGNYLRDYPTNHGHRYVDLSRFGEKQRRYVHRLVAIAFLPNPDRLPAVRHKDDDPIYNHVSNLEWGTQLDNIHDAINNGKILGRKPCPVQIIETKKEYPSLHACARDIGGSAPGIYHVLSGKTKTHKSLTFRRIGV
jgi:hypothetical protein